MKDYKRLTKRNDEGTYCIVAEEIAKEMAIWQEQHETGELAPLPLYHLGTRLCQLEDKIENGTLVELPRIIHPNRMEWFVQYQYPNGVIQYYICFSEAEAEAKVRELKGERLR